MLTRKTSVFEVFSKLFSMTRSKSSTMVPSKLMGLYLSVREGSLSGLMSIHNMASFQAVGMDVSYPNRKGKELS